MTACCKDLPKKLRLTIAQRLIKLGKDNIVTITYQVGYERPSNLAEHTVAILKIRHEGIWREGRKR